MSNVRIMKSYNKELISMVALNCNDVSFVDFPRIVYADVIAKTQQKLAQRYNLLERVLTFTVTDDSGPILIPPTDFDSESKVLINNIRYSKKEEVPNSTYKTEEYEDYTYGIYFQHETVLPDNGWEGPPPTNWENIDSDAYIAPYVNNNWYLNYPNMAINDEVTIYYKSINYNLDGQSGDIIIPEKYTDEVIRIATITMGKLGIVKFMGDKKEKYLTIIRTYNRQSVNEKQSLEKNRAWIHIKPYRIY